jgi:hypothetical protein
MGFECKMCKEHAQEKANKVTTKIRKVIYNTPCKDISSYNNSDIITHGSEIVEEILCCKNCIKNLSKDFTPEVIGEEKQVYNKRKKEEKDIKYRKTNKDNQNDYDDDLEYQENPEKYDKEI